MAFPVLNAGYSKERKILLLMVRRWAIPGMVYLVLAFPSCLLLLNGVAGLSALKLQMLWQGPGAMPIEYVDAECCLCYMRSIRSVVRCQIDDCLRATRTRTNTYTHVRYSPTNFFIRLSRLHQTRPTIACRSFVWMYVYMYSHVFQKAKRYGWRILPWNVQRMQSRYNRRRKAKRTRVEPSYFLNVWTKIRTRICEVYCSQLAVTKRSEKEKKSLRVLDLALQTVVT